MKFHLICFLLMTQLFSHSFAQSQEGARIWGDANAAQQYVIWAKQAIEEGRMGEALTGLERAADFAVVSSDISYLLAYARLRENKSRTSIVEALDMAIETNRWVIYNENQALLLKANQLAAMRRFHNAILSLDKIGHGDLAASTELAADSAMVRLLVFRGLSTIPGGVDGINPSQALIQFRSLMRSAMDSFPRDTRPLRIFLDYAYDRMSKQVLLTESDLNLLELVLRRIPFLIEADSELAWMSSPFMNDKDEARRQVAAYRAGGYFNINIRDFRPSPASIPSALNLGLLGDTEAVEELFSGTRGYNSPLPQGIETNGYPVLEKDVIMDVYNSLGSEEGRTLLTQKLLSFSGCIVSNDDHDGFIDGRSYYRSGVIREIAFDRYHDNVFDLRIIFSNNGVPVSAEIPVLGQPLSVRVQWERYPHVREAVLAQESFTFRPAEFQFAPVSFITLGGSNSLVGLDYPVLSSQHLEITRRTLVSFSSGISRPSFEFDGAIEHFFLDKGIPARAVEILNGNQISITEFENGEPVIQYVDLDLDGRMETIRRFRRPGSDYPWPDSDLKFDYHRLIASSESDWTGSGQYKTGEMYLQDGSVVYLWDMDGSGIMNYSDTETGNQ